MITMNKKLAMIIGSGAAVLTLAGCDNKITEPFHDAPRGTTNDKPADIITMPDGFSNVSAKCDGPNRVYVAFHGDSAYAAVAVAQNDPRCAQ